MELEGFWVFVFIISASTVYIFLMTRNPGNSQNSSDDENN